MVEAGELSIVGSIDVSMIERGFAKIKRGFDRVESASKSFGSDMVRIGQATSAAAKSLGTIATVGLTAMIGLAKSAPAVAPAMAKIGIEFQRLSRILGEQLRPFFESFSDNFTKFVNFVNANPDLTKGFVISAGAIVGVVAMTKLVQALSNPVSATMLAALATIAGLGMLEKGAEKVVDKSEAFYSREAESIPGTLQSLRTVDQSASQIAAAGFNPTPNGAMHENTQSRRWQILRWWDAMWS